MRHIILAIAILFVLSGMACADKFDSTSDKVGQLNKVRSEVIDETEFIKTHLPVILSDPRSFVYGLPNTTAAEADNKYYYKFGDNDSLTTTEETIWDGSNIYAYPPSASLMSVTSDSTADTQTGAGAWSVKLSGLDDQYGFTEEVVLLHGESITLTTNEYLRIFRAIVIAAGTSETADGNIYIGTGAVVGGEPTNIYAEIIQGNNQTQMAVFTIPAGKLGILITWGIDVGEGKSVDCRLIARPFGQIFQQKDEMRVFQNNSFRPVPMAPVIILHEKTDIEIRAVSTFPGTAVHGWFNILLEDLP